MIERVTYLNPEFFWLFGLFPLLVAWYIWKYHKQQASLQISSLSGFPKVGSFRAKLKPILFVLRLLALAAMIVALARPRTVDITQRNKTTLGIDMVLAIDVSGSMLAKDLKPNRLEALKKVASEFVYNRMSDRIGLVVYAAEAYTKTPITSDKAIVLEAIKNTKYDNVLQDGTGIGMGLATAVNRLKDSEAKSKVVILMTDGVNNAGFIEPETSADIAKEYGIKVYTIGIGTNGLAEFPYAYGANGELLFRKMPVEIDEKLMRSIAKKTDGQYFRATSNQSLKSIYDDIDLLEKTEIDEQKFFHYNEKYRPWLWLALAFLALEMLLKISVFRGFIH